MWQKKPRPARLDKISLPLWGRWQPKGLTDEGGTNLPDLRGNGKPVLHLTRPRWCSATLPKGEGFGIISPPLFQKNGGVRLFYWFSPPDFLGLRR